MLYDRNALSVITTQCYSTGFFHRRPIQARLQNSMTPDVDRPSVNLLDEYMNTLTPFGPFAEREIDIP